MMSKTSHLSLAANVAARARKVAIVNDHANDARTLVSAQINASAKMRAMVARVVMDAIWGYLSKRMMLSWLILPSCLLCNLLVVSQVLIRARRESDSPESFP